MRRRINDPAEILSGLIRSQCLCVEDTRRRTALRAGVDPQLYFSAQLPATRRLPSSATPSISLFVTRPP
jgi:hypothetical protein